MDLPPPMKYSTRAFSKARLISVGQSPLTKFIGIDFIYHYYSEMRKLVRIENIFPANLVVMRGHAWRNAPGRFVESYLSHITKTAVLCRVVFGGRILRGP